MFIFVMVTVLLYFLWWHSDAGIRAKAVLTLLCFISFGMGAINPIFTAVGLPLLCIVIGAMTFGVEWLSQRYR